MENENIKKIRIGNDIRLAVDLRQYLNTSDIGELGYLEERKVYTPADSGYENIDTDNEFVNKKNEVYYPNQYSPSEYRNKAFSSIGGLTGISPDGTPISIRSVKAFIINTSKIEEREEFLRKRSRFIARFPIEPCMDAFHATPYDVCVAGCPTYRTYPWNYHFMPYHGFGVNPRWNGIYKPLPHINDVEYRAEVAATKYQNIVEISFPARALLYTGKYKIIIVAEVYAPGFNSSNLKTITVDVPDVFELVKTTEEGIDTGVKIKVGRVVDLLPGGDTIFYDDRYVTSGRYDEDSNEITLNRTDGGSVAIDTSRLSGWYESNDEE